VHGGQHGQPLERVGDAERVPEDTEDLQRLIQRTTRCSVVALLTGHRAQLAKDVRGAPCVAYPPE